MIPLLVALVLCQVAPMPPAKALASYVPQRVYDTHLKTFADFESMLADIARADVIFVGEQHDDANTHRLELAVLEGLTRRRVSLVLGLEMFERDAQPAVDAYFAGSSEEPAFLAAARPWPRYATDYRASVEFAREHHIPLIASNVPRRIAAEVAKTGLAALESLGADRGLVAADLDCALTGAYYDRFVQAMSDHTGSNATPPPDAAAKSDRYYLAQCVKDETMGESIAAAVRPTDRHVTLVHYNGSFHIDFGQGTVAKARRRLPGRRLVIVSILPVEDLDRARPDDEDLTRADYLVYTVK